MEGGDCLPSHRMPREGWFTTLCAELLHVVGLCTALVVIACPFQNFQQIRQCCCVDREAPRNIWAHACSHVHR